MVSISYVETRLGKEKVYYRPGTADEGTIGDVHTGYHRPPEYFQPRTILDLGAHAGFAAVDLLALPSQPRVYAVEPAYDNYEMLLRNAVGRPRLVPKRAAVSNYYGTGVMSGPANNAYQLDHSGMVGADLYVYTVSGVLHEFGLASVDYIKMDVEGEEQKILKDFSWISMVNQCVKVELHGDYTVPMALHDLSVLGFQKVYKDTSHPACVVGEK